MKCSKCGWEGEESNLIEQPAELEVNDYFGSAIFIMGTQRRNFQCPSCRTPLQTAFVIYGWEQARESLR